MRLPRGRRGRGEGKVGSSRTTSVWGALAAPPDSRLLTEAAARGARRRGGKRCSLRVTYLARHEGMLQDWEAGVAAEESEWRLFAVPCGRDTGRVLPGYIGGTGNSTRVLVPVRTR